MSVAIVSPSFSVNSPDHNRYNKLADESVGIAQPELVAMG